MLICDLIAVKCEIILKCQRNQPNEFTKMIKKKKFLKPRIDIETIV